MHLRVAAGFLALVMPAASSAMPVQTFLVKAEALQTKGFAAMFSSDLKLLMNVMKSDAAALRAEREAATAAGKPAAYCPPGPVKLTNKDVMQAMQAVPAAERSRTDSRDALRTYLNSLYPCRR